ncbi:MAG: Ig-like domain-containing protein, partial [Sporichthyaceae bacterium]
MVDARGKRHAAAAALAALTLLLATGCQSPGTTAQAAAQAVVKAPLASISVEPAADLVGVRPDAPVKVTASKGKLTSVVMTGRKGRTVAGTIAADGASWTPTGTTLGLSTTYTVLATAVNDDGVASSTQSAFTTIKPKARLTTSISPLNGSTVGVGMPIVVRLSTAVKDRAAVERGLTVTSSKSIEGSWTWISDQELHFRPRAYWPAWTKVSVQVQLKDVETGSGVWGAENRTIR